MCCMALNWQLEFPAFEEAFLAEYVNILLNILNSIYIVFNIYLIEVAFI